MEEFDETLPESVFVEFHAMRNGAAPAPASKKFPLVWALVPAVAAGLAAVLLLRQPSTPDNGIRIIQQPQTPIAVVSDSTGTTEPILDQPLIAQAVTPKATRRTIVSTQVSEINEETAPIAETIEAMPLEDAVIPESNDTAAHDSLDKQEPGIDNGPVVTTSSPFIPEGTKSKPVKMKVAPAAGVIAGGGLLAAIATPLLSSGTFEDAAPTNQGEPPFGGIVMEPEPPKDEPTGRHTHYFPFKGGLSVGIPVSERLKVTTGLEYSLYKSSFTYTLSGEKKQFAHYLGIPVRLDWTLANNRWLDVYLGGGIEGDYCIGAALAGESIKRDGFSFSLLGAGGIQFNITKRIGIYVEPELSWTVPSENHVLETWRSEYPFMFSVATGLRINFGK
jgi:hypothetical protein